MHLLTWLHSLQHGGNPKESMALGVVAPRALDVSTEPQHEAGTVAGFPK